jgi:hypothetical protein
LVTREQLLGLGLGTQAIGYRLKHHRLFRIHRGVYAVGHPPISPLARAAAAVLACGRQAALSHASALTLWDVRRHWTLPFHVTVTAGDRRPAGIAVHRCAVNPRDLTVQGGIQTTSPARTLLDCAPELTDRALARAVNDARLRHILTPDQLRDALGRYPTHPGTVRLRTHAGADQAATRSPLEDEFLRFCATHGLPTPQLNAIVCGFEVDALFEPAKLIVELDSWTYHRSRAAFERDRERDAITVAAGYRTVRLTSDRLKLAPEREAQRLRAITGRPGDPPSR